MLLDPVCLTETLLDWLPVLERVLGPVEAAATGDSHLDSPGDHAWDGEGLALCSEPAESFLAVKEAAEHVASDEEKEHSGDLRGKEEQTLAVSTWSPPEPVRSEPPKAVQAELLSDLTQLATLYAELSCFRKLQTQQGLGCAAFLRRYFFLLDQERVRRACLLVHQEQPELQASFMEAMLGKKLLVFMQYLQVNMSQGTLPQSGFSVCTGVTQSSKVVEDIHRGNLLKSLRSLRELQPWTAPPLLAHLHRWVLVFLCPPVLSVKMDPALMSPGLSKAVREARRGSCEVLLTLLSHRNSC